MDKVFYNFKDVADELGYKLKMPKSPKEKIWKCSYCGGEMKKIEGTNIVKCTGTVKDDNGNDAPCRKFILLK